MISEMYPSFNYKNQYIRFKLNKSINYQTRLPRYSNFFSIFRYRNGDRAENPPSNLATRTRVSLSTRAPLRPRILYFRSFNRPRTSNWKKLFHLTGSFDTYGRRGEGGWGLIKIHRRVRALC